MNTDLWEHRSSKIRCTTCIWYAIKRADDPNNAGSFEIGGCRRRAPTMNGYPVVFDNDWCGDHKLDENKVK